jgi:hypothetical protein
MGIGDALAAATASLMLKDAAGAVVDEIANNLPLTKEETPRLRSPDRRLSVGLTQRDGKIVVVVLVEKAGSLAEKKAEQVAVVLGEKHESEIHRLVTGVAHSSKPDDALPRDFEKDVGTSIGHIKGYPGTLGCLVSIKAKSTEYAAVTSAAHVLSMLNRADKGDPIIVPGYPDGENALENKIGTLANYTYWPSSIASCITGSSSR